MLKYSPTLAIAFVAGVVGLSTEARCEAIMCIIDADQLPPMPSGTPSSACPMPVPIGPDGKQILNGTCACLKPGGKFGVPGDLLKGTLAGKTFSEYRFTQYTAEVSCNAAWDEKCERWETVTLPEGVDLCRVEILETTKNHGEWRIGSYLRNGVRIFLKSWGSQLFIDRWGGSVAVRVNTRGISSFATEEERKTENCGVPALSPSQATGTDSFCVKSPSSPEMSAGALVCQDWTMKGGAKNYTGNPYTCGVCGGNTW